MRSLIPYGVYLSFLFLIVCQFLPAQTAQQAEEMLSLVNGVRADNGVAPLRLNSVMNQAAYAHSYDMAHNNYFSHTGLNGSTFSQRLAAAGYTGSPRGENIAAGNLTVAATFNQWLNSSGHLNNMLNPNSNEMGIGYASYNSSTYTHYWTQVFGKGSDVLAVEEELISEKVLVFPNPVKDRLHIRLPNSQAYLDLKLVNSAGQIVYQHYKEQVPVELTINLAHLPSGIYFLALGNTEMQKIIKY